MRYRHGMYALAACLLSAPAWAGFGGGPLVLQVDATRAPQRILHAQLSLAVTPGPLRLVYPKYIPGEHGPTGPIDQLAGLVIHGSGKTLPWRRDPEDMYALTVDVPSGTTSLRLDYDFMMPIADGFSGGSSGTRNLAVLSWNWVVLYPDGINQQQLKVKPSVLWPRGWTSASALPSEAMTNGVTLETLVDSPVLAGAMLQRWKLGPQEEMAVAADSKAALAVPEETVAAYRRLASEARHLFGARPYAHYLFLVTASDHVAHFGLEHQQSSDNRISENALVDDDLRRLSSGLLPHEFVHAWNGKYRRPAGLVRPDLQAPIDSSMLWVYEGLTMYYGAVLTARSHLQTPDDFREELAMVAASMASRSGRRWRPLGDTATAAQRLYESPDSWRDWRRSVDFYPEGLLLWLEVDAMLRSRSKGRVSLDDFARRFYAIQGSGRPVSVTPYDRSALLAALQATWPMDWDGYFKQRLESVATDLPQQALQAAGWQLHYDDKPGALWEIATKKQGRTIYYDLGFKLDKEGTVEDIAWGGKAFAAGMAPGMKLLAINQRTFTAELLDRAIKSGEPLNLLMEDAGFQFTATIAKPALRYPHLERIPKTKDILGDIIKPRSS